MGFQVNSFKRTKSKKRRMSQVSNRSLISSSSLQELYSPSNKLASSLSIDQRTAVGDQIIVKGPKSVDNVMVNLTTIMTESVQESIVFPTQKSRAQVDESTVEYEKPAIGMQADSESNVELGAIISKEDIQTSKDVYQLSSESQLNGVKDAEANDAFRIIPTYPALDENLKEFEEKNFQNGASGSNLLIPEYRDLNQGDSLSGLPQTNLYMELGFDAIFCQKKIVEAVEKNDIGVETEEVDIDERALGVEAEEVFVIEGDANAERALLDVGKINTNNVKMPHASKGDNEIEEWPEEKDDGSMISESLHGPPIIKPPAYSSEPTPNKFEDEMNEHWKLRVSVLQCFKKTMDIDIKLCPSQCMHLMGTYLKCESFLYMHPSIYMKMDGADPETTQLLQSYTSACTELSNIMQHGAMLIWNCISTEWLRNALTMVINAPTPKHPAWKAISPFYINLEKFQWIFHFIFKAIKSLLRKYGENMVDLPTIILLDSYEDLEAKDREILLQNLLFNIKGCHPTTKKDGIDLAKFLVSKLQGQDSPKANLLQSTSSSMNAMPMNSITIGKGAFGKVSERDWLDIRVAIKEIDDVEAFKLEEEFVDLQHPHIVRVFDHGLTSSNGCIVMELMKEDLLSFIQRHSSKGPSLYKKFLDIMMQVAEALKYLNTNGVLHRGLKSKNIMVRPCQCGNSNCIVSKLGDFGISKYKGVESWFTTKKVGTKGWMAPEIMSRKSMAKYTTAVDVYSFAITCSEILSNDYPFKGFAKFKDIREQTLAGKRPNLREDVPFLLSTYIKRCWATNPSDRPQDFHAVCEFLQYFKEISLRGGTLDSNLLEVKERDAKMLLKHFGLPWCLQRDGSTGKLRHIPEELYEYVIGVAMKDKLWTSSLVDEGEISSIQLEIANYYGNWTSIGRDYEAAFQILQYLTSEGKCGQAIWRLGYCYELGLGVCPNFEEAAKLYTEAFIEADYVNALIDLGRCYILGRGVPQSIRKGSKYWDEAFKNKPLFIDSIIEQFSILRRNESNRLTSSKDQRIRAASRLLSLTVVSSGRKILLKALEDGKSTLFTDDQLWPKNLETESKRTEELKYESQSGEEIGEEEDANDTDNKRSSEELLTLREIFMHMRVDERTATIISLNKDEYAKDDELDHILKVPIFPLDLYQSRSKKPKFQFFILFSSFLFWFMLFTLDPWFYISSFLSPSRLLIIFASFSSLITLKLLWDLILSQLNSKTRYPNMRRESTEFYVETQKN